ncbi:MAG: hypothetical protein ABIO82_05485 [Ginsengibacter sp.]
MKDSRAALRAIKNSDRIVWVGSQRRCGVKAILLPEMDLTGRTVKVETAANTAYDALTSAHMRSWMECIISRKKPNATVEAGYAHSIANIMSNTAVHTGFKSTFDERVRKWW